MTEYDRRIKRLRTAHNQLCETALNALLSLVAEDYMPDERYRGAITTLQTDINCVSGYIY